MVKVSLVIASSIILSGVSILCAKEFDDLLPEVPPNLIEKKKYNALMRLPPDGRRGQAMADAVEDDQFHKWLKENPEIQKSFAETLMGSLEEGVRLHQKTELKKLMQGTGIKFTTDIDGEATVVFDYTDIKRQQQVWIGWNLTKIGNYSLRKVYSYAYIGKTPPTASAMSAALDDNTEMDTSRWSTAKSDKSGNYIFVLTALVPEAADAETLASIIRGVASRADNFEKAHFEAKQ